MRIQVFHSVNSALYFWTGTTGLLVDGIHGGPDGFSPMPESMTAQLKTRGGIFAHLDGVLFTHTHSDHFCREAFNAVLRWKNPPGVYGPGVPESSIPVHPLRPGMVRLEFPGLRVIARDTVHDGKDKGHPHQSYLLETEEETVFIAGDAFLSPEDADAFLSCGTRGIDAAFFNPYQLNPRFGAAHIRRLRPRRVFVIHLPLPQDDIYYHHLLAAQFLKRYPTDLPSPEILPHMAWLDGNAPQW